VISLDDHGGGGYGYGGGGGGDGCGGIGDVVATSLVHAFKGAV
jgi:hypothetical protein